MDEPRTGAEQYFDRRRKDADYEREYQSAKRRVIAHSNIVRQQSDDNV